MPHPDRSTVRNLLLRALPAEDFGLLQPHLEPVPVHMDEVVIGSNEPFTYAYFPESGVSSIISSADADRRVEIGLFGFEGMVSTALVLGADRTPHETRIQVDGTWLRIGADTLRQVMRESPAVQDVLMRYVQSFFLTVSQTALANGAYKMEERLARWLLMCHDRLEGDDLPLTHKFLSLMLGEHRPRVTIAIHILEGARMIRATRGVITVLDRRKLEEAAGSSYGVAEAEYERLIGPMRTSGPGLP